jgi:hypothetical protein
VQAIATAKQLGAKNAREAVEITEGRSLTEEEWSRVKASWEVNWSVFDTNISRNFP